MEDQFNVFCYGSHMSSKCLLSRTTAVKFVAVAYLKGYKLVINKPSKHGDGKANIIPSADANDMVWGAVYAFDASDKHLLDNLEGKGYSTKDIMVYSKRNVGIPALVHYAPQEICDDALLPNDWYKTHIIRGAEEHQLPPDYIEMLTNIRSVPDRDEDKTLRELSVYD